MRKILTSILLFSLLFDASAQKDIERQFFRNPVVQTCYSTDPAPMVDGDRLYLFTGHDEEGADFFWMNDWRLFSTTDMVNWTDHGCPLTQGTFSWADDRAWAAQTIQRNGKYYWYVCAHSKISNGMAIGVAVADRPEGPYVDALGKPLFENGSWDNIDPTVMIDDDGQAWLYWGNPRLYYLKLNEDMISYSGELGEIEQTVEGFGAPAPDKRVKDEKYTDTYTEGPWILKRNKTYYMIYAAGGVPEHIAYSTSSTPTGPWTYRGPIMPLEDTKSFTNHSGIAEFKGHSYFFYHTGKLPGGGGFGRSAAVEEFTWNPDGTFPIIHHTDAGVKPIGTLNPYQRVEGETIAYSYGVKTEWNQTDGVYVSDIHNEDWIRLSEVDFDAEPRPKHGAQFVARAACSLQGGTIEIRLDSLKGRQFCSIDVPNTGGWEKFQVFRTNIERLPRGKHEVFLVFKGLKGPKLMNLDYWQIAPHHDKYEARNPLFWADYPDPDIIRVGDYYYLVTTTMHLMPGAPIMRSRDLVNWETVSYLFDELKDVPAYDLQNGTRYGQGQWATSLRYHKGTFYALFVTNGVPGSWIYSTDDPAKGWKLHSHLKGFYHDPSLFFDDDDRVYIFSGTGGVQITELEADLSKEKEGGFARHLEVQDVDDNGLLEGSRVIKHDGYYYLIMISWPRTGRHQLAYRARTLDGRWEKRDILTDNFDQIGNVGQGTIVDGKNGEWYGVIFQDRNAVGRILTLSPCRWVDGWPLIGDDEGHVTPCTEISTVSLDRQWNHNPDKTAYTNNPKRKTLELRTCCVVPNIFTARNTLTWRMWGPECNDTICMDISAMRDGDRAGFAAFNGDSGLLTVCKDGKKTTLVMTEEHVKLDRDKAVTDNDVTRHGEADITGSKRIWLTIHGNFHRGQDLASFAYSTDGKNWIRIGQAFKMRFDYLRFFMGTRYAVFNYATKALGGKVTLQNFQFTEGPCGQPLQLNNQPIGLKDAYKDHFNVGVALNFRNFRDSMDVAVIKRDFNSITSENDMKPGEIHPKEDVWKWGRADSLANFCRRNGLKLRGHNMCWHSQFCDWMFTDAQGNEVSKEVFYERLRNHIHTVVNRYKDVVYCWDVVNEAMSDNGDNPYRQSRHWKLCGDEFIAKAFQFAHEADPKALLFYNDYNATNPRKRDNIYNMVKRMQDAGVPIHGIGMQGHYNIYGPGMDEVEAAIVKYSELVKHIHITELDIRANREMGGQLDMDKNGLVITPEVQQRFDNQYTGLFEVFRRHSDVIDSVTFWNLCDRDSWLGYRNYPLLYDSNLQPKRTYFMVRDF